MQYLRKLLYHQYSIYEQYFRNIDKGALRDLGQCMASLGLNHTIQRFTSYNVGLSVIIIN